MKNKSLIFISILFIASLQVFCGDVLILKSGRKLEGVIVVEGDKVKLLGKYGTIIFKKSDVVIGKEDDVKQIREVTDSSAVEVHQPVTLVTSELTTKSGRKIIGNVYQKNNELYMVDLGGTIKIDSFILAKKENVGENKIKGDVILGENCIVTLKSGRVFAGIVEEFADDYYVSSVIGTVKVEKKDIDNIHQTGVVLNLKEERAKLAEAADVDKPKINVNTVPQNTEAPNAQINPENNSDNKPSKDSAKDLSNEEIQQINKSAEDAIKASKEKAKVIKTLHEVY